MAVYRWVYDSRHLQAGCQETGSAPEPYARQSSMGYLYLFIKQRCDPSVRSFVCLFHVPSSKTMHLGLWLL